MLKRIALCVLALALLSVPALAAQTLESWCEAYNLVAGPNGVAQVAASGFEVENSADGAYHIFYFDDDTALMLWLEEDGTPYICAAEGKKGDKRLSGVLACALSATRGQSYNDCLAITEKVMLQVDESAKDVEGEIEGWYYTGGTEKYDGIEYVLVGFSYIGIQIPGVAKDTPPEASPAPSPAPSPSPSPFPSPSPGPRATPSPSPGSGKPVHKA
ncbi:MAG: hypothetical protein K5663_03440 [Clostridiales bacterium]|nr:hypothetical protein [Clostridiales bacterium]